MAFSTSETKKPETASRVNSRFERFVARVYRIEVISGMWGWNLALNYSSGCGVAGCQGCPMCSLRTVKTLFPWVIQELPIQSLQSWGQSIKRRQWTSLIDWTSQAPPQQSTWCGEGGLQVGVLNSCCACDSGWALPVCWVGNQAAPARSPGGSSCRINQIIHRWDTCK